MHDQDEPGDPAPTPAGDSEPAGAPEPADAPEPAGAPEPGEAAEPAGAPEPGEAAEGHPLDTVAGEAAEGHPLDTVTGEAPHPRRRRRWVAVLALSIAAVLVVGGGAVAWYGWRLNSNVERIPDPFAGLTDRPESPTAVPVPAGDGSDPEETVLRAPMNVLVLGSDSRISAGDPSDWEAGAQRTDTIMLVHLPADASSAYVMSIPRDSWVPIPGYGTAKINAAYSYGGPTLLIQTIEDLTGVRIDHFAVTDFESFVSITDSLGGVTLNLAEPLYGRADMGTKGELLAPAGEQLLDGSEALTWVRERYSLTRGDFDRVQRQQAWMRAILSQVTSKGILENPARTLAFLDTVSQAVAVDDGVDLAVMQDMVGRVRNLRSGDVHFLTVPISGTGWSPDGKQSIVRLNQSAFDELMAAVVADDVDGYLAAHADDVDQLGAVAP
ncbi:LCP family protein [Actinotalea sp. M2MS4P-6]|uniref:LCP family glycopolymer transferase n=1 Tax=Actinotalea sp. M2MS4P-6 TaxID=2983762 RepID=UPI0021E45418|nr:LCP family protein [Actinotalea sp. M2MS4P-6]MCV2394571.1 LCP family protein [Actinotalea sp. M2MS4P-6]